MEKHKKWLRAVEKSHEHARCCVCRVKFDIGNIRITAIESHSKGTKHKRLMAPQIPKQPTLPFLRVEPAMPKLRLYTENQLDDI